MITGPSGTNLHLAEELADAGGYRVTETVPPPNQERPGREMHACMQAGRQSSRASSVEKSCNTRVGLPAFAADSVIET